MHGVVASIKVTAQSADRIADFLPRLLAPRDDFRFKIGTRTFKIGADPERRVELDEFGNCAGTLFIENNSDPSDVSRIVCRLRRNDPNGDARLAVTFNPSRLLAGAEIVPTLSDSRKRIWTAQLPASSKLVNALLLGIGFDVLNDVYRHTRNDPTISSKAATMAPTAIGIFNCNASIGICCCSPPTQANSYRTSC